MKTKMKNKFLIVVSSMAILVLGLVYYQAVYQKGLLGQTRFANLKKAGGEGIARLRYDQNLTIELLSGGEYDFVVRYTVKTEEDDPFTMKNESAEIYLDPEGLIAFDVPPTGLLWKGDLVAGQSLALGSGVMVTKNDGKFLVRGVVGFGSEEEGNMQKEHVDLYVIVRDGKIVDVTMDGGVTAPTPEQAAEKLR